MTPRGRGGGRVLPPLLYILLHCFDFYHEHVACFVKLKSHVFSAPMSKVGKSLEASNWNIGTQIWWGRKGFLESL